MDTFIFIIFFFVVTGIFKSIAKAPEKKPVPKTRTLRSGQSNSSDRTPKNQAANSPWARPEFQDLKETLQEMSGSRSNPSSESSRSNAAAKAQRTRDYKARQLKSKANAAKKAIRLKAHDDSHGDTVEGRDISDQNKSRNANWGERAGPGILNTKTVVIAIAMSLIVGYVMVRI